MHVITKFLEYVGILIGILGFVKYKNYFFEILFKSKYQYLRYETYKIDDEIEYIHPLILAELK